MTDSKDLPDEEYPDILLLPPPAGVGKCESWFFTFTQRSPHHNRYLEIRGTFGQARRAMERFHGMEWAFQYSRRQFEHQPEQFQLLPLHSPIRVVTTERDADGNPAPSKTNPEDNT